MTGGLFICKIQLCLTRQAKKNESTTCVVLDLKVVKICVWVRWKALEEGFQMSYGSTSNSSPFRSYGDLKFSDLPDASGTSDFCAWRVRQIGNVPDARYRTASGKPSGNFSIFLSGYNFGLSRSWTFAPGSLRSQRPKIIYFLGPNRYRTTLNFVRQIVRQIRQAHLWTVRQIPKSSGKSPNRQANPQIVRQIRQAQLWTVRQIPKSSGNSPNRQAQITKTSGKTVVPDVFGPPILGFLDLKEPFFFWTDHTIVIPGICRYDLKKKNFSRHQFPSAKTISHLRKIEWPQR